MHPSQTCSFLASTARTRKWTSGAVLGLLLLLAVAWLFLPAIGAHLILHPWRKAAATVRPPPGCEEVTFEGEGVALKGWRGDHTAAVRRGTVVYLHGVADHRASGAGVLQRFQLRGFDVIGYDSRAHGESTGNECTYGFFEKDDLRLVLDQSRPGPIVLVGSSLGAAVALQTAAEDPRVSAVVAAEAFSDLRTVVIERAPFFFSARVIEQALALAGERGGFRIAAASPLIAAAKIQVPVLIVHGGADTDTDPDHARRIFQALAGPKRLILVPAAKHNASLRGEIWREIEQWVDDALVSGNKLVTFRSESEQALRQ